MSSALFKNKPYSYSHTPDIPSSPTGSSSAIPLTPRQDQQSFSAVPLSPGLPRHPIAPDAQAYLPPRPSIRQRPSLKGKERASFLDEILPTPTSAGSMRDSGRGVLRRTGAVAVILVFVLVASWLAATESGGKAVSEGTRELRHVFGQGMAEWAVQEALHDSHASDATAEASTSEAEVDAEKHGGQQIGTCHELAAVGLIRAYALGVHMLTRQTSISSSCSGRYRPVWWSFLDTVDVSSFSAMFTARSRHSSRSQSQTSASPLLLASC